MKENNKENEVLNMKSSSSSTGRHGLTEKDFDALANEMQEKDWSIKKTKKMRTKKLGSGVSLLERKSGQVQSVSPLEDKDEKGVDNQSLSSMEYEEEIVRSNQENEVNVSRQVKSITESCKSNNTDSERVKGSDNGRSKEIKEREVYWIHRGVLKKTSEIDATEMDSKKNERYDESHLGACKVILKLSRDKVQTNRGKNAIRIWKDLLKFKIRPIDMVMINHISAEVSFANNHDTNFCLDTLEQNKEENGLMGRIETRNMMCKGVVTEWPDSVLEFWDAISDRTEILKLERMYKKKWDKISKKLIEEDTGNIIVSMKGNKIKERIGLFDDKIFVKVKPYVFPVKNVSIALSLGISRLCARAKRDVLYVVSQLMENVIYRQNVLTAKEIIDQLTSCVQYTKGIGVLMLLWHIIMFLLEARKGFYLEESQSQFMYMTDMFNRINGQSYSRRVINLPL